jgi:tetratricopeptide (TPR) repeat protein
MGPGKNQFRLSILLLSGIVFLLGGLKADFAKAETSPSLQTFPNFSRLVFPVHPQATFRVQPDSADPRKFILGIEGPSMEPWGKTQAKDVLVSEVVVSRDATASKEAVVNLAGKNSEYFAYFQPTPPAVIVDIWPSSSPDPQRNVASTPEPKKVAKSKTSKIVQKQNFPFLEQKKNFFYEFPAVIPDYVYKGNNFNTQIERDPGSGWNWTEPNLETPGGINFSLAQKLFARKQYSLAIKSIEFARRDHSQSPYMDEMSYLEALSYRNLAIQEKNSFLLNRSEEQLKELMLKPAGKDGYLPFANKIRMYFASEAYRNQRWLDAISHFEFITTMKSSAAEADYQGIVLASAEAYLALRQFRRAERIYRSVMTESPNTDYAKEAEYRWGNLLTLERAFKKADEVFDRAHKEYPSFESIREEAFFNQAEANFGLGNFKKSQQLFRKFVELHPANTLGGMAYVRLGELAEMVDKNLEGAKEFYTQASRRFPYSVGDTLAKIRLARTLLPSLSSRFAILRISD